MKITTTEGITIEGIDEKQLVEVARKLGLSMVPMYQSETHGLMPISAMNTQHLANAVRKKVQHWASGLLTHNHGAFLEAVKNGPSDPEFLNLIKELEGRVG